MEGCRIGLATIIRAPLTSPFGPMAQYIYTTNRSARSSAEALHLARHQLEFLSRRQDRRARAERLGQVDAAQDHGGHGQGDSRRSATAAGNQDRFSVARARNSIPRRPCARLSRKASPMCSASSTASTQISDRFAEPLEDDEMDAAARRAGQAARHDRRRRAAGSSSASSKSPPTRCACRRGMPRSSPFRAASDAASRCAACCSRTPTCCCSTSRPTIWTRNPSPGSSVSWASIPAPSMAVTHDRYFLDNVAGWILELDRGHGIPWQGNYSSWLEQKEQRLELEEKQEVAARRRSRRSSSGCAAIRVRAARRRRRASRASRSSRRRNFRRATRRTRSTFRRARASATS